MRPGIQDSDTNRIKEGAKAFENWRAGVFAASAQRVKLPSVTLGCRRDFPGAEWLNI